MKLETESSYNHTYPNQRAAKVTIHNDNHFILPRENHFTLDMLEIDNKSLKEGNHGVKHPIEHESCKVTLPPQPHGIESTIDYANTNSDEFCIGAPYYCPNAEIGLAVKEDFYNDKFVAKVEVSEIIVCTNDGSCHRVVEDVSIPEEVLSFQNSLRKDGGENVPLSCNNNSDVEEEIQCVAGSHDFEYEVIDGSSPTTIDRSPADLTSADKSAEESSCVNSLEDWDENVPAECNAGNVSEIGDKLDLNDSVASSTSNDITDNQLHPSKEESLQEDLTCSDDQKHYTDTRKIDQAILETYKTTSTTVSPIAEDPDPSIGGREILSTGKMPSDVVTSTFDPQEASISSRGENTYNKGTGQSKQLHTGLRTEGVTFDDATTSRISLLHFIQGDSNFHGPSLLSSPRANSGYIAYSGNISLRSESSTTSAQSFAFPILQSEWNSSPVRMAKVRRWRSRKFGVFCCKF